MCRGGEAGGVCTLRKPTKDLTMMQSWHINTCRQHSSFPKRQPELRSLTGYGLLGLRYPALTIANNPRPAPFHVPMSLPSDQDVARHQGDAECPPLLGSLSLFVALIFGLQPGLELLLCSQLVVYVLNRLPTESEDVYSRSRVRVPCRAH